jgi:hypothetical protein
MGLGTTVASVVNVFVKNVALSYRILDGNRQAILRKPSVISVSSNQLTILR